jgi:hypothetical protein
VAGVFTEAVFSGRSGLMTEAAKSKLMTHLIVARETLRQVVDQVDSWPELDGTVASYHELKTAVRITEDALNFVRKVEVKGG